MIATEIEAARLDCPPESQWGIRMSCRDDHGLELW